VLGLSSASSVHVGRTQDTGSRAKLPRQAAARAARAFGRRPAITSTASQGRAWHRSLEEPRRWSGAMLWPRQDEDRVDVVRRRGQPVTGLGGYRGARDRIERQSTAARPRSLVTEPGGPTSCHRCAPGDVGRAGVPGRWETPLFGRVSRGCCRRQQTRPAAPPGGGSTTVAERRTDAPPVPSPFRVATSHWTPDSGLTWAERTASRRGTRR
jgi:hypothetical protein